MRIKSFVVQYASAFLNGFISFLVLLVLKYVYPESIYSQSSTILLLFSTYQVCVDLGTHQQYLTNQVSFATLVKNRMIFSLFALLFVVIHGIWARYSFFSFLSLFLLVLNFIPMSLSSAYDSWLFKTGDIHRAYWFRLIRILSLVVFAILAFTGRQNAFWIPFAGMLVTNLLASSVLFLKIKILFKDTVRSPGFFRESLETGLTQLFAAIHAAILWASMVRFFWRKISRSHQ